MSSGPITTFLSSIGKAIFDGWYDLGRFGQLILNGAPSPAAIAVAVTLILAAIASVWICTYLLKRFVFTSAKEIPSYHVRSMKKQISDSDMAVELTPACLELLGLKGRSKILVKLMDQDITRARQTVSVYQRQKRVNSFEDDNISLSPALARKFGNDLGDDLQLSITPRDLFPLGMIDWTINNPDQNTSLSWRMLIISTVVGLLVSVAVSQYYFELSVSDKGPIEEGHTINATSVK